MSTKMKIKLAVYTAVAYVPECWITRPLINFMCRKAHEDAMRAKEAARQAVWQKEYYEGVLANIKREQAMQGK